MRPPYKVSLIKMATLAATIKVANNSPAYYSPTILPSSSVPSTEKDVEAKVVAVERPSEQDVILVRPDPKLDYIGNVSSDVDKASIYTGTLHSF
jgi:hypothetical protein